MRLGLRALLSASAPWTRPLTWAHAQQQQQRQCGHDQEGRPRGGGGHGCSGCAGERCARLGHCAGRIRKALVLEDAAPADCALENCARGSWTRGRDPGGGRCADRPRAKRPCQVSAPLSPAAAPPRPRGCRLLGRQRPRAKGKRGPATPGGAASSSGGRAGCSEGPHAGLVISPLPALQTTVPSPAHRAPWPPPARSLPPAQAYGMSWLSLISLKMPLAALCFLPFKSPRSGFRAAFQENISLQRLQQTNLSVIRRG